MLCFGPLRVVQAVRSLTAYMQHKRVVTSSSAGFQMGSQVAAFCAGTVEVGAHTALLTLCVFIYMAVPFGIATAATIRVGNVRPTRHTLQLPLPEDHHHVVFFLINLDLGYC